MVFKVTGVFNPEEDEQQDEDLVDSPTIPLQSEENVIRTSVPRATAEATEIDVDVERNLPEREEVFKLQDPFLRNSITSKFAEKAAGVLADGLSFLSGEAVGATIDPIATISSSLVNQAATGVSAGGIAIVDLLNPENPEETRDFIDRFVSVQTHIQANSGLIKAFTYEPLTEAGQRNVEFLSSLFDLVLKKPFEAIAELEGKGIDVIERELRENAIDPETGEIDPEKSDLISEQVVKAKAGIQAQTVTLPDAALFLIPFARGAVKRAAIRKETKLRGEIKKDIETLVEADSNVRSVPLINLKHLEGAKTGQIEIADIIRIQRRVQAGETDLNVVLETVGGKPTRIITGAENLQLLEYLNTITKTPVNRIKATFREKPNLTNQELINLEKGEVAAFSNIFANEDKLSAIVKAQSKTKRNFLNQLVIDRSGNVKKEVKKLGGDLGEIAIEDFELMAGASPYAHLIFNDMRKAAYGRQGAENPAVSDLPRHRMKDPRTGELKNVSEHFIFDYIVHALRVQEIIRNKPGSINSKTGEFKDFNLRGPLGPNEAPGFLFGAEKILGEKRFAQLKHRADQIFLTMRAQLDEMLREGLISPAEHARMKDLNYVKRSFRDEIDPTFMAKKRGKLVEVRESGLKPLKGGTKARALESNVQKVAAEHIMRTRRRIAKNRATRTLASAVIAGKGSMDSIVRVAKRGKDKKLRKPPSGWQEVRYMDGGKKKALWMRESLAEEWITGNVDASMALMNSLRIISGTFLVKPLATGANPGFAVRNFLRDIQHAWIATGGTYSTALPLYLKQISQDIRDVRSDAFFLKGRYRDFVAEGGMTNFLTEQGFEAVVDINRPRAPGKFRRSIDNLMLGAGFLSQFSEIVVRLAIRERVIKNQIAAGEPVNTRHATHVARNYLDFSQGGTLTKHLDGVIPYLNANVQALRTAIRAHRGSPENLARALAKDAQLLFVKGIVSARAWEAYPEVMRDVDQDILNSHFVYPTGLNYLDDDGNLINVIAKIPLDGAVLPFTAPMDMLLRKHYTGFDPSPTWMKTVQGVSPVALAAMPPSLQAYYNLTANKDFWTDRDLWRKDPNVPLGLERTNSEFFNMLGELAPNTISPVRTQAAVRTLAPTNTFIFSADWWASQVVGSEEEKERQEALQAQRDTMQKIGKALIDTPIIRRAFGTTHPSANMKEEDEIILKKEATRRELLRFEVDEAVKDFRIFPKGDERKTRKWEEVQKRIASDYADRPDLAKKAINSFIIGVHIDEIYSKTKATTISISKETWSYWAGLDAITRAQLFYGTWRTSSVPDRNKMFAIANALDQIPNGRKIITAGFMEEFAKNVAEFGNDIWVPMGSEEP